MHLAGERCSRRRDHRTKRGNLHDFAREKGQSIKSKKFRDKLPALHLPRLSARSPSVEAG